MYCFLFDCSQPPIQPAPKNSQKLSSLIDEEESERSSQTAMSFTDDKSDKAKPQRPSSPVFAKTKKISEIAARRRLARNKSTVHSRSSLGTGDEIPVKSNSVSDMRAQDPPAGGKKMSGDKGGSVKASLSLSDLSVIDKKLGDASSEESAPANKRRADVKSKAKKEPPRKPRRLRSASLDETKVLRRE